MISNSPPALRDVLGASDDQSAPLSTGPWRMRQRWNDLLFAHWPIAVAALAPLIPADLELDLHDGFAWVGVVPFWMDQVENRLPFQRDGQRTVSIPYTRSFSELNLRTYVRSPRSGFRGVFFFSLDCASPLAVLGARTIFHLPYFFAAMQCAQSKNGIEYQSRRLFSRFGARFDATYRSMTPGVAAAPSQPGSLEHFLTERYCLFTPFGRRMLVGHIHHLPWPLEPAEAEIRVNDLPAAHGIILPNRPPVLHFARELQVSIRSLGPDVRLP